MKITRNFKIVLALTLAAGLASCRKDKSDPEVEPVTQGVYVLNQGSFQGNNSSLSYYDFASKAVTPNYYGAANSGSNLGDTGNDIMIAGSKMYIAVNGSNKVEVVDARTAKKIKSITITSPRYLALANGKVFVSSYADNVYAIDTAALTIAATIPVGADPEGMAVVGNKLYVANSGGLGLTYDNTVSVIDVNSLTELKKITVDINPNLVVADKYGDVYVTTRGNYGNVSPNLYVIKTVTDQVIALNVPATDLAISNDIAYIYKANYSFATGSYDIGYLTLNVQTETLGASFITDGTSSTIQMPYSISVDPISGDIYIADVKDFVGNGAIVCYGKDGKKKFSTSVGVSPGRFAFYVK